MKSRDIIQEAIDEEKIGMQRTKTRNLMSSLLPPCKNLTPVALDHYRTLADRVSEQIPCVSGLATTGFCFIMAAYYELIALPCEGGCAKAAKRALGYKFCPHCGSKL